MASPNLTGVSGFPEWLPATRRAEQAVFDVIRSKFELYGFMPIETPAVERLEVLDAKGGVGRQIFKVTRPAMEEDQEGQGLGLHFDLTVPLARYVIQHANDLTFPFRRYQMQKVWRGERAQRGRFREFYQCDIDVIGRGSLDPMYDAEIPCVIFDIFSTLEIGDFSIHISSRKVLGAVFAAMSLMDQETTLLRIIDRFHKVDRDAILQDLINEGLTLEQGTSILRVVEATSIEAVREELRSAQADESGLNELEAVYEAATRLGMPAAALRLDFSIARGLDYYTGAVFETFISGREAWGSVCSGGRYDNLAAYFGGGTSYPGVGISIGLTRLISLLEDDGRLPATSATPTKVLVATLDRQALLDQYLEVARTLRGAGIETEIYLGEARLADQLKYASSLGVAHVVIIGQKEAEAGSAVVRHLAESTQSEVQMDAIVETIVARRSPGA